MDFLYTAVSWVLLRWHSLFNALGLDPAGGLNWALSVIFLVVTARLLLFRLFIKQVHYQRHMQEMQPQLQKIREKYKNDRAEQQRQMMALQQEQGFNPLAGCLPMFLQIPVFIGLYHVLRHVSNANAVCQRIAAGHQISAKSHDLLTLYTFSQSETCKASTANIFNAPLAASFHDAGSLIRTLGGDPTATRIVLVVLLIISASATFGTQLLVRRNATTTPVGTAATVQRAMLYLIPIGTLASGLLFNFPLGVLLYWFTSNTWTLLQQAYVIRYHPPEKKDVEKVGALGKSLAPKPGQRPARTRPSADAPDDASMTQSPNGTAGDSTAGAPRTTAPRPGQRPQRPAAKRPPSKRPSQAKKRR